MSEFVPPTRNLFLGKVDEELSYPYPQQAPDDKEIADMTVEAFREWAADNLDAEQIDKAHEIPETMRRQLGELGMLGVTVPEEYGGGGFGATSYCRLVEEMTRSDGSLAVFLGAHLSIGAKPLLLFGNDEQKARYLPKVATGETLCAFALTEPGSGSDAQSMRTVAIWDEAEGVYKLNGNKIWITNGAYAGLFSVFAKARGGPKEGPVALLVERGQEGFTNGPPENKLGIRGTATTELAFQDVRVKPENILGEIGDGFNMALDTLDTGRLSLGAGCTGGSKGLLQLAVEHARERKQFRKAIIDFGMVREKLGRMASHIYASESMTYMTSMLMDCHGASMPVEAGYCKVLGSETLWNTVNDAIQIAGGIGYMEEYPYQRHLRDSRINLIFEGTNEILRLAGTLEALKVPARRVNEMIKLEKAQLGAEGVKEALGSEGGLNKAQMPSFIPEQLSREGRVFAEAVKAFELKTVEVLRKYKRRILAQQYTLRRLADAAIQSYAMMVGLSRASSKIAELGAERAASDILLVRRFVEESARRVHHELATIDTLRDEFDDRISEMLKEEGRYPVRLF